MKELWFVIIIFIGLSGAYILGKLKFQSLYRATVGDWDHQDNAILTSSKEGKIKFWSKKAKLIKRLQW